MFRYLAFISDAGNQLDAPILQTLAQRLARRRPAWREVLNEPGLRLYCTGAQAGAREPYLLHGSRGAVFGTIFSNGEAFEPIHPAQRAVFDAGQTDSIIATRGRQLIGSYWGCYVAFLRDRESNASWVVCDPTGAFPCYWTAYRGIRIFFSQVTDCLDLGLPPFEVNWDYISQRVATPGRRRTRETALRGVERIYGGECLELKRGQQIRNVYWDPFKIAERGFIEDPQVAMAMLRATIKHCTHAWASCYGNILHRLSGGLDSSIVLSCLADAPTRPKVVCLTTYLPGQVSNERPWARLAASHARCEHVELPVDLKIDLTSILRAVPDAQPEAGFWYMLQSVEAKLALDKNALASFNGDGGDSLLGATTVRFAVYDYLINHPFDVRIFKVAADNALFSDTSIWRSLAQAVREKYIHPTRDLRAPQTEPRRFTGSSVAANAGGNPPDHPWSRPPDNRYRSLLRTVSRLALPLTIYDPLCAPDDPELARIAPLVSQPVIELCLRIPSYVRTLNGASRGLARRAFANDVPREILQREWKDSPPTGSHAVIFEHNRQFIRQTLLDGVLAKRELIDPKKLEAVMGHESFELTRSGIGEVFDYMNIEGWLRNWTERSQPDLYSAEAL